jgi:uncharacterized membrane protein
MTRYLIGAWIIMLLISIVLVSAQTTDAPTAVDSGQFEEITSETVRPAALEMTGRFHPMVIHFPIAWMILLSLAELFNFIWRQASWRQPVLSLHVLALLSFIPAAVTGFILAAHSGTDPEFLALVIPHRNLNIAGAALCLIALALRINAGKDIQSMRRITGVVLLLLIFSGASMVLIASHYGGEMVYGESFLPF